MDILDLVAYYYGFYNGNFPPIDEKLTGLLHTGQDVNYHNISFPLIVCASNYYPRYHKKDSNEKNIKKLLIYGANINLKNNVGETSLFYAVYRKSIPIINLLLQTGADIHIQCSSLYMFESYIFQILKSDINDIKTIKLLVYFGINVNLTNSCTPPLYIIGNELTYIDIFQALIDCGANINFQDTDGASVLMCLAQVSAKHTKILLDAGANPDLQNNNGMNALLLALHQCPNIPYVTNKIGPMLSSVEIVNMLIQKTNLFAKCGDSIVLREVTKYTLPRETAEILYNRVFLQYIELDEKYKHIIEEKDIEIEKLHYASRPGKKFLQLFAEEFANENKFDLIKSCI